MAPLANATPTAASGIASLWKGALLLAGLAAAGLALRGLDVSILRQSHPTVSGAALLVGAGALLAAVGVPRQVVAFAGGYAFGAQPHGVWIGGVLALLAQVAACIADFGWARLVAQGWARRRLTGRLARLDRFIAKNPFTATLTLRLLPVGNNLALNLLAGVSGVRAWPFFVASALGYVPQTVVFALAGSGAQLGRGLQIGLGMALFAVSGAIGALLLRRYGKAAYSS